MIGTAILFLFILVGVRAQPHGIALSPVNGCAALPNYNKVTEIAGPWTVRIDACTQGAASRGTCNIEGFATSYDVKRSADEKGIEKGVITISDNPERIDTKFRCNGALQTFEALVPSGAGALDWHAIGIDEDPGTGEMEWGMGHQKTSPAQVYRQYVQGRPVDGLFLGSKGRINWAVRPSGPGLSSLDHKPFWFLRLLNTHTGRWKGEYEALLRIDGS